MDADLILEGGGVKGIALVGSYTALSEAGYDFHRIAGTSAGAIVGALIAAGMSPGDLKGVMREIDYGRFEDKGFIDHLGLVGKGASLLFEKGIYEGSYLRAFMDEQLKALGVETFGDLRIDDPGASPGDATSYRLVVMTSDVTRARLRPVAVGLRAVRARPRRPSGSPTRSARRCRSRSSTSRSASRAATPRARRRPGTWSTAACCRTSRSRCSIARTGSRPGGRRSASSSRPSRTPRSVRSTTCTATFSLARAMVGTMTSFHDQIHIDDPSAVARTMFVDTFGIRATDFDIDETMQDTLFKSGRQAAEAFLRDWDFETYLATYRSGEVLDVPELVDGTA